MAEVAANRGILRAQVALAWVLQKEPVTAPIVGATKPHHLEDAVAALSVKLDATEIVSLEGALCPASDFGILKLEMWISKGTVFPFQGGGY
ncbi:aldo/keto reductase family protein [Paenibacillus prosopidis]|uniref:Aldo/keto reductase family protein n=1 Tax=Paenibacillus prosopidis TaxID=630520 RepID=A0A368VVK5_9BACL|nr:aldo/keto reductase family protein [Paenibacillus prosopidis]